MKILFVSDTVMPQLESAANLRRRYSDIDVIVSCGDLPSVYLEYITSILNVPLFYVRGNHDTEYIHKPPGGVDLHRQFYTYKGLSFYGLEGSFRYNETPVKYTQFSMWRMVISSAPMMLLRRLRRRHAVDVFVTHSPARGIHDGDDVAHQGFDSFLFFLNWYRPRYMVHGHVHTWDRRKQTRTQHDDTCIININPYTVLEIEPNR